MTQIYLSFTQLSAKLGGRSRSSIYRDLETGRLPQPVRLGGRVYFAEAEIDAAIKAGNKHRVSSSSSADLLEKA